MLILAIIAGYILQHGWPEQWHPLLRISLSTSLLVGAFSFWGHCKRPTSTLAKPARKPKILDYLAISLAVLLVECFFLIFFTITLENRLLRFLNSRIRLSLASDKRLATLAR